MAEDDGLNEKISDESIGLKEESEFDVEDCAPDEDGDGDLLDKADGDSDGGDGDGDAAQPRLEKILGVLQPGDHLRPEHVMNCARIQGLDEKRTGNSKIFTTIIITTITPQ